MFTAKEFLIFKKFPNINLLILLFTATQIFTIFIPVILGWFIDGIIQNNISSACLQIFMLAVCILFSKITYYKFQKLIFISRRDFELVLQNSLLCSFLRLPHTFMKGPRVAKFCAKFFRDCIFLGEVVHKFIIIVCSCIITGFVTFVICFIKNIYIGVIVSIITTIIICVAINFKSRINKSEVLYRKENDCLWDALMEFLKTIPNAKMLGVEKAFFPDLQEKIIKNKIIVNEIDGISILFENIMILILSIGEFILISISGYLAYNSIIPIGDIIVYQMLFTKSIFSMTDMFKYMPMFELAKESLKSYFEQINDDMQESLTGKIQVKKLSGEIEIKNLYFKYTGTSKNIFTNYCLHISAGDCVAITGKNGSGKTTLFNLLLASLRPDEGEILIDGLPLVKFDRCSYRKLISAVPQEVSIFNANLKENITLRNEEYSNAELSHAVEDANLKNFILRLPYGLNTSLMHAESILSGGERQRIAISRSIIRKSKLFIFDEITNHVDKETKESICNIIKKYKNKSTIIMFTHDKYLISLAHYQVGL